MKDPTFSEALSDSIRFALQVMEDSRRTLACHDEVRAQVEAVLRVEDGAGIFKIITSPYIDPDKIYIIDHNAQEADFRSMMQRKLNWSL